MSVRFSIGALLALLALSLLPILLMRSSPTATAGHSGQYVAPGAPWTGSWGYRQSSSCSGSASWSDTVPTGHHYFNGDFGVDYYGCTGTVGRFYSWDPYVPGSNSSHGVVGASPGDLVAIPRTGKAGVTRSSSTTITTAIEATTGCSMYTTSDTLTASCGERSGILHTSSQTTRP
jgi:hypothetical protein